MLLLLNVDGVGSDLDMNHIGGDGEFYICIFAMWVQIFLNVDANDAAGPDI